MKNKIIDAHTHIFSDEALKTYLKKAQGRVERMIVIHDIMPGDPSLSELLGFAEEHKELAVMACIRLNDTVPIIEQTKYLEKLLLERKLVGVKMYPGYEHFHAADKEVVYPVAQLCQKHAVPLMFHGGDVWDPVGTSLLEYSYDVALQVDRLAVDFPELNIVIAHFNFPKFMECANVMSKRMNVYADISGTIDADSQPLVEQYVADLKRAFTYFSNIKNKVMFGTDYCGEDISLNQFDPYVELVERVFSQQEEQESVFSGCAKKVFFSK